MSSAIQSFSALKSAQIQSSFQVKVAKSSSKQQEAVAMKLIEGVQQAPTSSAGRPASAPTGQRLNVKA